MGYLRSLRWQAFERLPDGTKRFLQTINAPSERAARFRILRDRPALAEEHIIIEAKPHSQGQKS